MSDTASKSVPSSLPARRRVGSMRGAAVCVAMFALGGLVLWGLFLSPRGRSPAAPDLPWGAPAVPVHFASIDLAGHTTVATALIEQIRALDPDVVLVQNIRFHDVHALAAALGLARSFHPQLFQRANPRAKEAAGDLILSKHALYDAGPVAVDTVDGDTRGVCAVAVLAGTRFVIVNGVGTPELLHRALDAHREQFGPRPTVLATGMSKLPHTGNPLEPTETLYADADWATVKAEASLPSASDAPTIRHITLQAAAAKRDHRD